MTIPPFANVGVTPFEGDFLTASCDCLVAMVGGDGICAAAKAIDQSMSNWLSKAIESGSLKTGFGDLTMMPAINRPSDKAESTGAQNWLFVGAGKRDALTQGKAFELGAIVTRRLVDAHRQRIIVSLDGVIPIELAESFVSGAFVGCDGQAIHMTEPKINPPENLEFDLVDAARLATGKIIGDSINLARRLVNEPPNVIYPESFADAATAVAADVGLESEVWDEKRLEAEGCRAILAVGRASHRPPRLVLLKHRGADPTTTPIAIIGKGVTFDSGGLSIKPSEGMVDMKCDMAGAATVIGIMRAVALLKLPINVIGLCGLAENMISGDAYRLGDVIETRNGTMIEILNTDAEGRVVLADTLDVAVQHQPSAIVDMATLTGACMVALGRDISGLMSNNEPLSQEIMSSAKSQGEFVWPLPMFDFFDEQIKSKVADIKNVGDGRWGGAITAAKFLQRFVNGIPWVHLDIAGPAFADSPKPHRDAGATGVMLRTLVTWLQTRSAG